MHREYMLATTAVEVLEFAIENFSKMMGYIALGNLNIRIHKDITGKMWFE